MKGMRRRVRVWVPSIGALALMLASASASAEWYVGGYGGVTTGGSIANASMPRLGDTRTTSFLNTTYPSRVARNTDFIETSFNTSDLSLRSVGMGGIKAGYFFDKFRYPWLGLEVEGFMAEPNIKSQTFDGTHVLNGVLTQPDSSGTPAVLNQTTKSRETITEARLRMFAGAVNVIVRYPGTFLQPYAGIGVGVFRFSAAAPFEGTSTVPGLNLLGGVKMNVSEHVTLFVEGKYNRASINLNDPTYGLQGDFQIFHLAVGAAYRF